jgi:general secretion pathway protein L
VTARAPGEARLAELRELGAAVLGVGVMDDVAGAAAPLNLLPPEKRDRPATPTAAIAARVLAAVAVILALVALVYPLWLKREAVIALHPRLDRAKAGAQVAERLAKEIEKLASEHNFVLARKQGQQPVVVLLEDLSRLLPDTTWVQQLDVKTNQKAREVQIAGESGSSSQLIEVLEQSGKLVNAGFKSPLTKGVTPNTERFLLAAEVKPRPLPEPTPESALVALPKGASAPVVQPVPPSVTPGADVPGSPAAVPQPASAAPGGTAPPTPAGAVSPAAKPAPSKPANSGVPAAAPAPKG